MVGNRARRASDADALRATRIGGTRSPILREKRRSSGPQPPLPTGNGRQRNAKNSKQARPASTVASLKPNTISLNEEDNASSVDDDGHTHESEDHRRVSSALDSVWSPNSVYEADEDASVRPIPPSAPPSPSPSRSSSSYLSDPRTFASMAVSTKPTTLLSVDLTGGMAHIAQAPPTPTIPNHRLGAHLRTHSTGPGGAGSITFSALPPATSSSRPSSNHGHRSTSSRGENSPVQLQAPQHTTHHPRNNPRPSSPPLDDASVLTLASSAFGMPGSRFGVAALTLSGRGSIADDSLSHFSHPTYLGDSTSHFVFGEGDDDRLDVDRDMYGDVDASVRALRPRSSRRGSWESEASRWSARLGGASPSVGPGTPGGLRDRSLWTSGSYRTGPRSISETETSSVSNPDDITGENDEQEPTDPVEPPDAKAEDISVKSTIDTEATASTQKDDADGTVPTSETKSSDKPAEETTSSKEKLLDTPKGTNVPLDDQASSDTTPTEKEEVELKVPELHISHDDAPNTATTEVFVSAPSTPLP